jgi:hypothetical protein
MNLAVASAGPSEVEVRFRLRPPERILYSLLFWRPYRVFALLGLMAFALGFVPVFGDARILIAACGAFFITGFAWLPFAISPRARERRIVATADSVLVEVEGVGGGPIDWRSFRELRRTAGALVLGFGSGNSVFIPLRAFGPGHLEAFESLASSGMTSRTNRSIVPAEAGEPMLSYRYKVGLRRYLLDRGFELGARPALFVGLAMVVVGLVAPGMDATASDPGAAIVACGVLLAALPWAVVLAFSLVAGPRRMLTGSREVAGIEAYRTGYLSTAARAAAWTPWASFGSARMRGDEIVFRVGETSLHCHFPIGPLAPDERVRLREILAQAGIPMER